MASVPVLQTLRQRGAAHSKARERPPVPPPAGYQANTQRGVLPVPRANLSEDDQSDGPEEIVIDERRPSARGERPRKPRQYYRRERERENEYDPGGRSTAGRGYPDAFDGPEYPAEANMRARFERGALRPPGTARRTLARHRLTATQLTGKGTTTTLPPQDLMGVSHGPAFPAADKAARCQSHGPGRTCRTSCSGWVTTCIAGAPMRASPLPTRAKS